MLLGLGAWFAKSALMTSPIGGLLKLVPGKVWLVLIVAAVLLGAYLWHGHKVKAFGEERYTTGFKAGYAAAQEDQRKVNAQTETKTTAIAADVKGKNHEANARTNAAADFERLHGPGKASAKCPTVPASSGGPQPAGDARLHAGDSVSPNDRFSDSAVVPWGWLVSHAQSCDLNRNEVLSWREWYGRVSEAWPKSTAAQSQPR